VTAPTRVQPRTVGSAALARFQIMCADALECEDPDRAYGLWLEYEHEVEQLRALIREAVGGAARDLAGPNASHQDIADRHGLTRRTVQAHVERAPLDV
jgi:hypothetical protein